MPPRVVCKKKRAKPSTPSIELCELANHNPLGYTSWWWNSEKFPHSDRHSSGQQGTCLPGESQSAACRLGGNCNNHRSHHFAHQGQIHKMNTETITHFVSPLYSRKKNVYYLYRGRIAGRINDILANSLQSCGSRKGRFTDSPATLILYWIEFERAQLRNHPRKNYVNSRLPRNPSCNQITR